MLSRPNTLDHYFDKSDYPEHTVFIPNLVPCYSECNIQKGTEVFCADGKRKYIHFYYDKIPNYQFLFIRLKMTNEDISPTVEIYLEFPINESQKDIISAHIHNLKLIRKYKETINSKLSVIINEIQTAVNYGFLHDNVKSILEVRYQAMLDQYGYNYWESCIYEGVLNSPNYLNQLLGSY